MISLWDILHAYYTHTHTHTHNDTLDMHIFLQSIQTIKMRCVRYNLYAIPCLCNTITRCGNTIWSIFLNKDATFINRPCNYIVAICQKLCKPTFSRKRSLRMNERVSLCSAIRITTKHPLLSSARGLRRN
jgi:hypothetical protein